MVPLVLNLGTSRILAVKFTNRGEKSPVYPFNRTLVGPQNRSRRFERERNILRVPVFDTRTVKLVI